MFQRSILDRCDRKSGSDISSCDHPLKCKLRDFFNSYSRSPQHLPSPLRHPDCDLETVFVARTFLVVYSSEQRRPGRIRIILRPTRDLASHPGLLKGRNDHEAQRKVHLHSCS